MVKQLQWHDLFSVGVKLIDNQHKKLFAIINELINATENKQQHKVIKKILAEIIAYTEYHFSSEEKFFKIHPDYEHHCSTHKNFVRQAVDLAERYPGLDLIIGHCGATDFWNDVVDAGKGAPNVYLESSLARPFQFNRYLEEVGYQRGIMGSFVPINDLVFEWEQMRGELPSEHVADVCGGNLLGLLEKRGAL